MEFLLTLGVLLLAVGAIKGVVRRLVAGACRDLPAVLDSTLHSSGTRAVGEEPCLAHPKGAEACLAEQARGANLERLQALVVSSLRRDDDSRGYPWGSSSRCCQRSHPPPAEHVETCLVDEGVPPEVGHDGFGQLVATGERPSVLALLRSIRRRSSVVLPQILRQALTLFEALQGLSKTADGRSIRDCC